MAYLDVFIGVEVEAIHEYMNEPELAFYFQTSDASAVPDYELVYMPLVVPVREAIGEFEQPEEIDYSFSAFKR